MVHQRADPEADWADAILGTDLYAHSGFNHFLQAEVDTYLNDISIASYSNIISFWQVSGDVINSDFLLSVFTHSF